MVIHSVTPPHMLVEQPELPKLNTKQAGNDYFDVYDTPQGQCVSRIHSTDLSMYLKPGFSPGSVYKNFN